MTYSRMIILLSVSVCAFADRETELGWSDKQVWSSDHNYVLVNVVTEKPTATEGGENQLWLLSKDGRGATCCYTYDRDVAVMWSPDSKHFVVNDYAGSSEIYCIVVTPTVKEGVLKAEQVSVSDAFMELPEAKDLDRMIHQYILATRWLDDNTVRLNISGYPAADEKQPDSVEWSFDYDLAKKTFTKCDKVEEPKRDSDTTDEKSEAKPTPATKDKK